MTANAALRGSALDLINSPTQPASILFQGCGTAVWGLLYNGQPFTRINTLPWLNRAVTTQDRFKDIVSQTVRPSSFSFNNQELAKLRRPRMWLPQVMVRRLLVVARFSVTTSIVHRELALNEGGTICNVDVSKLPFNCQPST